MPSEWYVVSVHLIPWQASQRLSMTKYTTGTATEIRPQRNSNPVLTSTSHQVAAGMRFNSHYKPTGLPLLDDNSLVIGNTARLKIITFKACR